MTSSTFGGASLAVPSTQNTAPILEFRCLYTHDLRRKSKRWQDGYLRFHTFNKRVMVYDLPRNYVGDCHWREKNDLADGDELELERGGIMVQVGEAAGKTEQDLTVLFEKKLKDREERQQILARSRTPLRQLAASGTVSWQNNTRLRSARSSQPWPPNSVTPPKTPSYNSGQARRTLRSPFEQRKQSEDSRPQERISKKRKDWNEPLAPLHNGSASETNKATDVMVRKKPRRNIAADKTKPGNMKVVEVSDTESVLPLNLPTTERGQQSATNTTRKSPFQQTSSTPSAIQHEPQLISDEPSHITQQTKEILQQAANPLRLASRPTRKKLLCQDLLPTREAISPTSRPLNQKSSHPPPHTTSPLLEHPGPIQPVENQQRQPPQRRPAKRQTKQKEKPARRTSTRIASPPIPARPPPPAPQQERAESVDTDLGPWSREAYDLFDWRPPDKSLLAVGK